MRKLLLFNLLFTLISSLHINAQLSAGDIAIIGVNEDSEDSFSFIALTDIPANQIIYFTEQGWNNNNTDTSSGFWIANTEGHYSWTAPAGGLSCGTIIKIEETSSNTLTAQGGGSMSGLLSGSFWSLTGGDQIIAYASVNGARPAGEVPTFISAIHLDDSRSGSIGHDPITGWSSATYVGASSNASHVPPGLTNGDTCIALFSPSSPEQDNAKFTGSLIGTSTVLRQAINTSNENGGTWTITNSDALAIAPGDYAPAVTCAAVDTEDPVITCPSDVMVGNETGVCGSGIVNIGMATATDNVAVASITNDAPSTFPIGSTTVTWTATDAAGNSDTCMQTVTINDTELPTIGCPGNMTVQADEGENFASGVMLGMPNTADNCSVASVTNDAPMNFPLGATTVTWTVTDTAGNMATCQQTVTVNLCNGITSIYIGSGTWIPNPPSNNDVALLLADYNTSVFGSLSACAITVDPGLTLTVGAGTFIQVVTDLTVNGTLTFEPGSSFTQLNSSSSINNNGTINVLVSDPVVTTPAGALTVDTATQTLSGTHTENGVVVHAYADADNNGVADNTTSLGSATVAGNAWSFSVNLAVGVSNNFVVRAEKVLAGVTGVSADVDVPTILQGTPTVTITSSETNPTSTSPIPITVTFSEDVSGFESTDISFSVTPGGGGLGSFTQVSASEYMFDITPNLNSTITINIPANIAQDVAGNGNTAATEFSIVYDDSVLSTTDNKLPLDDFFFVNPVLNDLTIKTSKTLKLIQLYNLEGELVASANGNTVDTSSLSTGLYMAFLVTENGQITTVKVIKK